MPTSQPRLTSRQLLFREMVLGTLVYTVVLGFFNDYTTLFHTNSYSTTFLVAFVLQVLTYLTLLLKKRVAGRFTHKTGFWSKAGLVGSVWAVLFLSKFVFLAVIEVLFRSYVEISGFVGLMVVIVIMTVAKQGIDYIFNKLGDEQSSGS